MFQELDDVSEKIQKYIAEYRNKELASFDLSLPHENRSQILFEASKDFMNKVGVELLPTINRILGEVEALLSAEDKAVVERILPILTEARKLAQDPVNQLVYSELSAQLSRLRSHLSAGMVIQPRVFVGHGFSEKDRKVAEKFIQLFKFEGFNCITGEPAKAMNIGEKVTRLIDESDGVIIIFHPDKKIEGTEYWTTSPWLINELSFAMGRNKQYLIFYDDSIDSDQRRKGIQADYEYVHFNSECLDDSFLEAIPYLRDFKERIIRKDNDPL